MVSRRYLTVFFVSMLILVGPGCVARDKYLSAKNTIQTQDAVINNYKGTLAAIQGEGLGVGSSSRSWKSKLNSVAGSRSRQRAMNVSC